MRAVGADLQATGGGGGRGRTGGDEEPVMAALDQGFGAHGELRRGEAEQGGDAETRVGARRKIDTEFGGGIVGWPDQIVRGKGDAGGDIHFRDQLHRAEAYEFDDEGLGHATAAASGEEPGADFAGAVHFHGLAVPFAGHASAGLHEFLDGQGKTGLVDEAVGEQQRAGGVAGGVVSAVWANGGRRPSSVADTTKAARQAGGKVFPG